MKTKKNEIIVVDSSQIGSSSDTDTAIKERTAIESPSKYNVIMHNDSFTPMGFVVEILVNIYNWERTDAIELMLKIHNNGKGVAGTYTKSIAEFKMMRTREIAEQEGFNAFKVTIEKVS